MTKRRTSSHIAVTVTHCAPVLRAPALQHYNRATESYFFLCEEVRGVKSFWRWDLAGMKSRDKHHELTKKGLIHIRMCSARMLSLMIVICCQTLSGNPFILPGGEWVEWPRAGGPDKFDNLAKRMLESDEDYATKLYLHLSPSQCMQRVISRSCLIIILQSRFLNQSRWHQRKQELGWSCWGSTWTARSQRPNSWRCVGPEHPEASLMGLL